MNVVRDPIREAEPAGSGTSVAAVVLVPLGLVVIAIGLCLGLWLVGVAYNLLYHPTQVPLVSQVLELIEKDDKFFEIVQEEKTTRVEGAAIRYGLLLLVLFVVVIAIGSVIKAFLGAGRAIMEAGFGRPRGDPPRK